MKISKIINSKPSDFNIIVKDSINPEKISKRLRELITQEIADEISNKLFNEMSEIILYGEKNT